MARWYLLIGPYTTRDAATAESRKQASARAVAYYTDAAAAFAAAAKPFVGRGAYATVSAAVVTASRAAGPRPQRDYGPAVPGRTADDWLRDQIAAFAAGAPSPGFAEWLVDEAAFIRRATRALIAAEVKP